MSGWLPQINDWDREGLEWQYIDQSIIRPFELMAKSQIQLPTEKYTFKYPEGVLIHFSGGFDHPTCGIRIESDPNFDTKDFFTVNTLALGGGRPEILAHATVPPATPPGFYGVRILSPWVWKKWLRIYLFNPDSISHRTLGHSYHMVVLKEPRREIEKVS